MRLSEKKQSALYSAIADPVMDLRLSYTKASPPSVDDLDAALFKLQNQIWRDVHKTLNLEGPA